MRLFKINDNQAIATFQMSLKTGACGPLVYQEQFDYLFPTDESHWDAYANPLMGYWLLNLKPPYHPKANSNFKVYIESTR